MANENKSRNDMVGVWVLVPAGFNKIIKSETKRRKVYALMPRISVRTPIGWILLSPKAIDDIRSIVGDKIFDEGFIVFYALIPRKWLARWIGAEAARAAERAAKGLLEGKRSLDTIKALKEVLGID